MKRTGAVRFEFLSSGFREILTGPSVDAEVAAAARKQAADLEAKTGVPYRVEKYTGATTRSVYVAKRDGFAPTPGLTHEQWMSDVWPKVGGAKWRPKRSR